MIVNGENPNIKISEATKITHIILVHINLHPINIAFCDVHILKNISFNHFTNCNFLSFFNLINPTTFEKSEKSFINIYYYWYYYKVTVDSLNVNFFSLKTRRLFTLKSLFLNQSGVTKAQSICWDSKFSLKLRQSILLGIRLGYSWVLLKVPSDFFFFFILK